MFAKVTAELFFTFCTKQLVTEKSKQIKFLYKMKNITNIEGEIQRPNFHSQQFMHMYLKELEHIKINIL